MTREEDRREEGRLSPQKHKAKVADWCYGMTGGIKVNCWCGYTVYKMATPEYVIRARIDHHNKTGNW